MLCEDDDAIIDAAADLPPSSDEEQVDSAIPASSVTAKAVPAPSETVQELAQCNLGPNPSCYCTETLESSFGYMLGGCRFPLPCAPHSEPAFQV